MPDLVRVKLADGTEKTMGRSFAESHDLTILDKPTHVRGHVLADKRPVDLRGAHLDAALAAAGLPKGGTADEKRARLEEHQSSVELSAVPATGVGDADTQ